MKREKWQPGTQILERGIVHNKVLIVRPVTVIEDNHNQIAIFLQPGTPCKIPSFLNNKQNSLNPNGISRWEEQDSQAWQLHDWTWQTRRILMLLRPEKYYAVCWFWLHDTNEFEGWYINFQLPFSRTTFSLDTLDLEIDMVIKPDLSWQWKDEPEYQRGIASGSISASIADKVEVARREVEIELQNNPAFLDPRWHNWQPDPNWEPAKLLENWNEL